MKKDTGFSLIELLIVVAIIGIIATIAIPNLLQARKTANEASAISVMRNFASAQVTYQSNNQTYGTISQLDAVKLIDPSINTANGKSGYWFGDAQAPTATQFNQGAIAWSSGSGDRRFSVIEDGVIRFDTTNPTTGFVNPTGRTWTSLGTTASAS